MDFMLFYRGSLKSNGNPKHKHNIRKHFHPQLKQLWNQEPLLHFQSVVEPVKVDDFRFKPLVCQELHLVAQLHVTLLRPEAPGSIITTGGDIDNRVKTLLDSLKIPEPGALPHDSRVDEDEVPFFCLLEDDHLVTELMVSTVQLLEPMVNRNEVVVLLKVTTIKTGTLLGGMELP
jgi:Holliday junction resolvase RusA-like endonuclease